MLVADMRDRIRLLGALLAIPLLGLGSSQASAGQTKKKAKKKAKRKTKKRPTKVSEPGTLALMGAGLVVAGAAHKMGRKKKKNKKMKKV